MDRTSARHKMIRMTTVVLILLCAALLLPEAARAASGSAVKVKKDKYQIDAMIIQEMIFD